jgi:hypothetical protein
LPAASFRFHLAMDTLAVRLAVPLIGPAKVFHLLGLRPAGRTKKRASFPERTPVRDAFASLDVRCVVFDARLLNKRWQFCRQFRFRCF